MSRWQRTLVTAALPYANGDLHLGHLAGAYLPADIYVRTLRLRGREVLFICGTDEYGVPITKTAESLGITPQELVDRNYASIRASFAALGVSFDNFSQTSRPIHTGPRPRNRRRRCSARRSSRVLNPRRCSSRRRSRCERR